MNADRHALRTVLFVTGSALLAGFRCSAGGGWETWLSGPDSRAASPAVSSPGPEVETAVFALG